MEENVKKFTTIRKVIFFALSRVSLKLFVFHNVAWFCSCLFKTQTWMVICCTRKEQGCGMQLTEAFLSRFFFFHKRRNSLLVCWMLHLCCLHKSKCCIWACILHQSDWCIRVCILHQSDNTIEVCLDLICCNVITQHRHTSTMTLAKSCGLTQCNASYLSWGLCYYDLLGLKRSSENILPFWS